MARENLRASLHDQVERSIKEGATLLLGGVPLSGEGCYYPPTILDNVKPNMTAFREETFGPVAAIIRADNSQHAIELANDTEFGLGAALWTSDLKKVIEGGGVEIDGVRHSLGTNDTTWLPANVPHRFLNVTDKPMRIFWTYATVDATRTMLETGQTHTIDAEHQKGTTIK